jgi:hypothetical protein
VPQSLSAVHESVPLRCPEAEHLERTTIERDERRLAGRRFARAEQEPRHPEAKSHHNGQYAERSAMALHTHPHGIQSATMPATTCENRTTSSTITADTPKTTIDPYGRVVHVLCIRCSYTILTTSKMTDAPRNQRWYVATTMVRLAVADAAANKPSQRASQVLLTRFDPSSASIVGHSGSPAAARASSQATRC